MKALGLYQEVTGKPLKHFKQERFWCEKGHSRHKCGRAPWDVNECRRQDTMWLYTKHALVMDGESDEQVQLGANSVGS